MCSDSHITRHDEDNRNFHAPCLWFENRVELGDQRDYDEREGINNKIQSNNRNEGK